MKHYYSISEYPGRTGLYFYTYFFQRHGILADYTPLGVSPADFEQEFQSVLNTGASGISISMPFKQQVLNQLHSLDASVSDYGSCNTVVVQDGHLTGYNCDLAGVEYVCEYILPGDVVSILGSGAMAKMFQNYLASHKYPEIRMYSRSMNNWSQRHSACDVLINCTALGTVSSDSPVAYIPDDVHTVIDLAIMPGQLKAQCLNQARYISGQEFYMHQFIKQYHCYTGITVTEQEFLQAQAAR